PPATPARPSVVTVPHPPPAPPLPPSRTPFRLGQASACSATVTDTSVGIGTTPPGSLTFTANGGGLTNATQSCTLGSGSCSASFTPTADGSMNITPSYRGDTTHTTTTTPPATPAPATKPATSTPLPTTTTPLPL